MKIGIDARMYGPLVGGGGLGRYVEQLVNELQVTDLKNRYLLFLKKENFDACKIVNPNFEKRLADVHWYSVQEQLQIGKIIDREQLDVVHFPHWNIPLFIKTPFIVTIHDLILLEEPTSAKVTTRSPLHFFLKYIGYKFVLGHAIHASKKIIAVSNATKASIQKFFPNVSTEKISVVYEGVTPLSFSPNPLTLSAFPYVLYVGNAYPHKNLERLLEAFAIVRSIHPEVKLVLAGRDSIFYERLKAGSGDPTHSSITFVANPTDQQLAELYRGAKLYVYPSRIEGFGLPPLEAMSAGIPVAASDIPCLKEILSDAAVYFDPLYTQSMANAIVDVLDSTDLQKDLIEKGHAQLNKYSWQKMASDIQSIYETCGKKTP